MLILNDGSSTFMHAATASASAVGYYRRQLWQRFASSIISRSDVKSSTPKWPRGQNFGLDLGLGLEVLASAWPRSHCLIM